MILILIASSFLCSVEAEQYCDPAKAIQYLADEVKSMDAYQAKEAIDSKFMDTIWSYGTSWPFLTDEIDAALKSQNSDILYLLTRAASLNPEGAGEFMDNLLSHKFRDFEGTIPPIDSERMALCSIDIAKYVPDAMNVSGWDGLSAILLFRNLGRSSIVCSSGIHSIMTECFPPVMSTPPVDRLKQFTQDTIPLTGVLRTRNLASLLSVMDHSMADVDLDGIPDSMDSNPIQASNRYSQGKEEMIASLAIKCKIMENKETLENFVVVVSPSEMGIEIPPVRDSYLINITAQDRSLFDDASNMMFTMRWQPIYLLDFSTFKEGAISQPEPCMPAQAVEIDESGNFAQVVVAIDRPGDHTTFSHYIFFKKGDIWTLYDIVLEGYIPCCQQLGQ